MDYGAVFTAVDDAGYRYIIREVLNGTIDRLNWKSGAMHIRGRLETDDGQTVHYIRQGVYEILCNTGLTRRVTSADPCAP
jgi:hypothetical protein